MDGWRGTVATTGIFTAAAVTDWLDGYIARKVPTLNFLYFLSLSLFPFGTLNVGSISGFQLNLFINTKSLTCYADENEIYIWCLFRSSS